MGFQPLSFLGPHLPPPHPSLNTFSPPITPHFITLLISFPSTVGPLSILSCSLSAERKGVSIKIHAFGDFPGCPVVRTWHSHCHTGFSPWLGTYDSTTCTVEPKKYKCTRPFAPFLSSGLSLQPFTSKQGKLELEKCFFKAKFQRQQVFLFVYSHYLLSRVPGAVPLSWHALSHSLFHSCIR